MKKLKITNNYNYELTEQGMEFNDEASMTVPGQSYNMRELLAKHASGIMPGIAHPVDYNDIDDFEGYDPTLAPDYDLADVTIEVERLANLSNKKPSADTTLKSSAQGADLKKPAKADQAGEDEASGGKKE